MANKLDVTKLYLLTPTEYRYNLDLKIETDKNKCPHDKDDDDESKHARAVNKLSKQFVTRDVWVATLCVWKGIKEYYDTSNKAFSPSTTAHIASIGNMCKIYGWERVRNYEIAFFQRYSSVQQPEHAWALVDNQLHMLHLQMGTYISKPNTLANTDKPSVPNILCRKFNEGKFCSPNQCRFQHRCTYDQNKCNGPHPASNCPLNPNKTPLSERINSRDQQPFNPNYTQGKRGRYDRERSPQRRRD
jgi:hypothetical protein